VLGIVVILGALYWAGFRPSPRTADLSHIILPEGFIVKEFATHLGGSPISIPGPGPGPRLLLQQGDVIYVTIPSQGTIIALPDRDKDGEADEVLTFADGLDKPHGIDFHEGYFYIAEESRVIRLQDRDGDHVADEEVEVLISDLPTGRHFTRTIKVFDNSFFLSVGSSCNVCIESEPIRAAITRCDLDGENCQVFARGLRNSVGMVFHEGLLYATDNGRDWLGDDLPPDEVNIITEGADFGWPICYGQQLHDSDFDKKTTIRSPCEDTVPATIDLQAHSAPLGLAFTPPEFPKEWDGLFVAYHGSWNRGEATGYKVVHIDLATKKVTDFMSGFLQGTSVLGRPVDVLPYLGGLLVSDDNAGKIYWISYEG